MKVKFISPRSKPLLVSMMTEQTPEACILNIRQSIYDGAGAFALHLEVLERQYHNIETLRRIFAYTAGMPVLTIHYRNKGRKEVTDEELASMQFVALEAGSSMCDIMGDIFDPSPMELSMKPGIIDKQKSLIEKIHSAGGEVLMSSHTWMAMNAEQTVQHAKELESRGADMVKIAMCAHNEDELLDTFIATAWLKRELKVPFLHICMGQYGKLHRVIAPAIGSYMVLCVQYYSNAGSKEQPLLRAAKAVYDNMDPNIARDVFLGTRGGKKTAYE